jgi:hypothetical protein
MRKGLGVIKQSAVIMVGLKPFEIVFLLGF